KHGNRNGKCRLSMVGWRKPTPCLEISSCENAVMQDKEPLPIAMNKREREILARLATGLSDQQIADELFLSLHTIKWYNRQIFGKLGVNSRTQAITRARALGLIGANDLPAPMTSPASDQPLPVK